jgi:GT2 family glycosyltransferase
MNESIDWTEKLIEAIRLAPARTGKLPLVSIITPTWNTRYEWLADAAISMLRQTCADWEWCIVDDASTERSFHSIFTLLATLPNVRILKLATSHGISGATNQGLALATGRWVGFLDHDDSLTPDALAEMTSALDSGYDAVYSDQDKISEQGEIFQPFHKPEWSPEFFRGVMYVGHLLCVRRDLALEIGGFRKEFDGVQDFEFMLRLSEKTKKIGHVSKILYHWRISPGSIAGNGNAKSNIEPLQCAAVQGHLDRLGLDASAVSSDIHGHRVRIVPRPVPHTSRVTVIIPTKDSPDILDVCLSSIFGKTSYRNLEVVCVDNNTTDPRALRIMQSYPVTRICWTQKFNFSAVNNFAVSRTEGDLLVFMNNDVEVRSADWIEHMRYYAEQPDVGAVGAMLLYPDQSTQHVGVVLGCRGTADHVLRGAPYDSDGYAGSISCAREVSAVTAACLMVRRSTFLDAGGFNEHYFTAYQDVDLCLKLRTLGKRNIYTPGAILYHHESATRGGYYDLVDRNLLLDLWEPTIERGDPYYNPNFNVQACDYSLRP